MARRPEPARNLLEMIPLRNREWVQTEDGRVKVLVPRLGTRRLGLWIAAGIGRPHIPVRLDEVGSAVWRACDGTSTVGQIAEALEERFGNAISPTHERLAKFFGELERGRLIKWADDRGLGDASP